MVLALDAGNSALKVAAVADGVVGSVRRISAGATHSDLVVQLGESLAELDRATHGPDPAGRLISMVSVVPEWTERLGSVARELGLAIRMADASTIPLATHLTDPARAGADRLLGAWTARQLHGAPVIVVDLGTATTVEAVDDVGVLRGGAILPGLQLAADALARGTAALPALEPRLPASALGVDTHGAMQSGVVIGHLGALRELVTRMARELGARDRPRVVVSGGFAAAGWARAAFLEPAGDGLGSIADVLDPDLLLRGLDLLVAR